MTVVLQLNLKDLPEKETIRKVANTTEKIIQYLFSQKNLSDFGSIDPAVGLSAQLKELAEELGSTAGDVVDYCKSNDSVNSVGQLSDSASFSSSSRSALTSKDAAVGFDEDMTEKFKSTAISNRLGILAKRFKSTRTNVDSPAVSSSSRPAPTTKDGVVGFDQDLVQIMDQLVSSSSNLQVLSIVGMGGIGKTTLAKLVYDHPLIIHHFDVLCWTTISQDYSVESILLNLLASVKGRTGRDSLKAWDKYSEMLEIYQHLKGRRYLIVMDDMWSTEAWDMVSRLFPDDNNGSRIIVTTRLQDVAGSVFYAYSHIHMVRFLDDNQSWDLFQQKVFADQTCPLELEGVAKKIIKSCGGLPLSIVTVAGLLSKIGNTKKIWEQIVANDGHLETILSSSYTDLPHHLKKCFLYMSGFPEDYEIRVSELIKLWIAEGFVRPEKHAEDCLKYLVDKSLVLVIDKKTDGKIKSCRLHNMVRDFCIRQAEQKKFLLPVMDYLPSPIVRRHFLPRLLRNHQRISASWYDLDLKDSVHSSCTHSIICIPQKGYKPKCSVRNFSSLRVFHVLRRNDHSYWQLGQVFDLIHLTHLASNIPSSSVPPTISNLQNLQTLIIYRSGVRLPVEIWRMRKLRHLIAFSFDSLPHPEDAALPLVRLLTLSLATNFVCSERMMKIISNINKLGICYSEDEFDEGHHCVYNLKDLFRLEKLKLEMHSSFSSSLNLGFPLSLKKLNLSGCRLPWEDMEIVGRLPNLQVLKLRNYACDGEHWKTNEGEFGSLRFLLIDESNLQHWTTESSHFPNLKCLMLHRCPNLYEIPSVLGDIPTLELIEVDDHNKSLLYSAKRILEDQRDNGNYDIQVRVKRF